MIPLDEPPLAPFVPSFQDDQRPVVRWATNPHRGGAGSPSVFKPVRRNALLTSRRNPLKLSSLFQPYFASSYFAP